MTTRTDAGPIVVGVDASAVSVKALQSAISFSKVTGGEVIVIFSRQFPPIFGEEAATAVEAIEESIEEHEERARELAKKALDAAGVKGRFEVRDGDAAQALIAVADESHAAHIVIGAHRHGVLSSGVLASVAGYLVHHSEVSFTVIRPDEDESEDDTEAS